MLFSSCRVFTSFIVAVVFLLVWECLAETPNSSVGPATTQSSRAVSAYPKNFLLLSEPTIIPFEIDNGLPIVEAIIPGGKSKPFVIDTGALLTTLCAGRIEAPATHPAITGLDFGDHVSTSIYTDYEIRLGNAVFSRFDVAMFDLPKAATSALRQPYSGLLGWTLFNHALITIDYQANQITVEKGSLPPVNGADILELHINQKNHLEIEAKLDGRPIRLWVDTGSGGGENVSINESPPP